MRETKFKNTEIGKIPKDWGIRRISDFTNVYAGGTPSTMISKYWNGNIPWLNSGEINKKYVWNVDNRITQDGLNNSSTRLIPKYCVLIGLAGQGKTRGTAAINMIELCTNQSVAAIFPSNELNSFYLYHYFDGLYVFLREISSGEGGRGGLTKKIINEIEVPIPPKKEQEKIATYLSDVDELIDKLTKLIEKKKLIKKGTMQELFRNNSHNKQSVFSDIFDVISTVNHQIKTSQYMTEGDYPVIDQGKEDIVGYSNEKSKVLNIKEAILFGDHTRIIKYIDRSFIIGADGVQVLVTKNQINTKYMYYYLQNFQILNTGYNRHFKYVKELVFNVPNEERQNKIANILLDIDTEIEKLEKKLSKYKKIKLAMMDELLTGKTRLI